MKKAQGWIQHIDFIVIDVIAIQLAFVLAYVLRFGISNPYSETLWLGIIIVMTLLDVLVIIFGNTLSDIMKRGYLKEAVSIFMQALAMEALTAFYLYITYSGIDYSRIVIGLTGVLLCVFDFILRALWKKYLRRRFYNGSKHLLLIGSDEIAVRFAAALDNPNYAEYKLCGYLAEAPSAEIPIYNGTIDKLEEILSQGDIREVVTALSPSEASGINKIVATCEKFGLRVSVIPAYSDVMSSQASIEEIGDIKLLNFRTTPLDDPSYAGIKRIFDIFASLIGIILTSPIMLIAAIGTKLSSPGPILFKQERVGRNGKTFTMLKFRSMRMSGQENTAWSGNEDPRRTAFGAFLRKFSLDELPQFFNVFAGQMSLIGPRPELPFFVNKFSEEIPMYRVRLQVRPGITGWAQVNGLRGDTDITDRVKYDIWYIENWSITLEIKIILMTIFGGMINKEKIN
ncbi:MAG: undecaprenyl-phosphate glucose phosphotransferase [Lachnospiraceae bacterium]|nr:undecaprenyl-phosphate glucose phosphotransferase [Candidatus Minthocola equi]